MPKPLLSPEYKIFLKEFQELRESAGLSQAELAEKVGMDQGRVSRSESGSRRVDIVELILWCAACGVPLETFIERLSKRLSSNRLPKLLKGGKRH